MECPVTLFSEVECLVMKFNEVKWIKYSKTQYNFAFYFVHMKEL